MWTNSSAFNKLSDSGRLRRHRLCFFLFLYFLTDRRTNERLEQILDKYEDIKLGELHGIDAKKVGRVQFGSLVGGGLTRKLGRAGRNYGRRAVCLTHTHRGRLRENEVDGHGWCHAKTAHGGAVFPA